MEIPAEDFAEIIQELVNKPIENNIYRKKAGAGRSVAFGLVNRRCLPPDLSRQCWRRPYLFKLLIEFGKKHVHIPWNAITVNQDYQASPHYDKNNVGNSFLVAFGEFTGGELNILEGERTGKHNICRRPIIDDFSKILHSVENFTGHRYSLVFYTLKIPRYPASVLPDLQIEERTNPKNNKKQWCLIYQDKEFWPWLGLPHPKRKNNLI